MANDKINQLQQGLSTAFVDASVTSNLAYKPQFISNNYKNKKMEKMCKKVVDKKR